ncbi:FtsK/SpoIIIE domain-containing protein [Microbacterium sp.]|uniref:FtsK/SpoIIIE domain-containing protein n=1 Tax=Microbacterium sp. TaxID=51671 RepID=UPI0033416454
MEAPAIVVPSASAAARRPSLPVLAAAIPIVSGVVMWMVTQSLLALCFAALGPLMLAGSAIDRLRTGRRDERHRVAEVEAAWNRAEEDLTSFHRAERDELLRRHPDTAACLAEPPLCGTESPSAETSLVVGRGTVPSSVRLSGGDDERAREFRRRASVLREAPIAVSLSGGLCIRAAKPLADAVTRALVVQLALRFTPGQLSLCGEGLTGTGLDRLPHAARSARGAFRLSLGGGSEAVDARIVSCDVDAEAPDGVTTVLDVVDPQEAMLRTARGSSAIAVEGLSAEQTRVIAEQLLERRSAAGGLPESVALAELPPPEQTGLLAAIGSGEHESLCLDLVEDGPHAIVTGMTGMGKSELLITWVTSIARSHSPERVAFVLADFKGGTAFDPLRELPHVAAVVTDLDTDGARRGVESLSAELRRREEALAAAGVRDIRDHPGLGRLVVVVDEFAALVQEHADLAMVFTDVAARGRALGMHLVLGTQRATGVIRDALAANCPLRVSLRVADAADSRLVVGTDAAAGLPGDAGARGLALIRRPRDQDALAVRVARTSAADVDDAARRWHAAVRPVSPWLPALPGMLPLDDLLRERGAEDADARVIGRADDPRRQRQPLELLRPRDGIAVIGGPGAGKSTALRGLERQAADALVVSPDAETAWDAVSALALGERSAPFVVCDDLDLLVAAYPAEYAQAFVAMWERIVRLAPVAVGLSRVSGPLARVIDAIPRRALLRMPGKAEHLAAGGEPEAFRRDRPAGRAAIDGREVQWSWTEERQAAATAGRDGVMWVPGGPLSGVVTGRAGNVVEALRRRHPDRRVVAVTEVDAAHTALAAEGLIVVGDPEGWRAQWALAQRIRSDGELLVAAECAAELRQIAGVRDLPPFAELHAGRAWAVDRGQRPERVRLLP